MPEKKQAVTGDKGSPQEPRKLAAMYGIQARTLIFLTLFFGIAIYGAVLMALSQEKITDTSTHVREVLLPASRLFEQAKNEIDLQVQEISLVSQQAADKAVGPQNIGILRLGPGVRSLVNLRETLDLSPDANELYRAWLESADDYQEKVNAEMTAGQSLIMLKALRQKTHIVHRAIDREFSMQLFNLSQHSERHLSYWLGALILLMALGSLFIYLLWRWMKPLDRLTTWLLESTRRAEGGLAPTAAPPASPARRGPFAPPREVIELIGALRYHIEKYKDQARELESRSQKNKEDARAISTLFSASLYLSRHNDELLKELIKSERLASMGEMAAQLAHEIRNPLNSLNLKLELLREELKPGSVREQLDSVLGEIDRLNNLTEDHLMRTRARLRGGDDESGADVVRSGEPATEPHSAEHSVASVLETLQPELNQSRIEVRFDNARPGGLIPVPAKPFKAVLLNLVKNAREAIEEAAANDATANRTRLILIRSYDDKDHWTIEVNDTGCGFPPGFTPSGESFQSTKKQGFGLGLATSIKMLQRWKAKITVHAGLPPYQSTVRIVGEKAPEQRQQRPATKSSARNEG